MKRIGLSFFLFLILFFPEKGFAKEIQLNELIIKNGELSIPFEPLNNEYTVTLPKEEYHIELEYKVEEGVVVSVLDNYDLENNAVVTLFLTDQENQTEYHLHILKEEEEATQTTFSEGTEKQEGFMFQYKNYVIPSSCFILLFIVFKILFPKKHKKRII